MKTSIALGGGVLQIVSCRGGLECYVFMFDFCEDCSVVFEARCLLTRVFQRNLSLPYFHGLNYLLAPWAPVILCLMCPFAICTFSSSLVQFFVSCSCAHFPHFILFLHISALCP